MAVELGADELYINEVLQLSSSLYRQLNPSYDFSQSESEKTSQADLVEPIYKRRVLNLINNADLVDAVRLNSLSTPHATAWTPAARSPSMKDNETRFALKWILGIPFAGKEYKCPNCGKAADALGVHQVACGRTGEISKGHTRLRNTLFDLLSQVKYSLSLEKHLPNSTLRPGDVFIANYDPLPLAVDCTIVTPTRIADISRAKPTSKAFYAELMD